MGDPFCVFRSAPDLAQRRTVEVLQEFEAQSGPTLTRLDNLATEIAEISQRIKDIEEAHINAVLAQLSEPYTTAYQTVRLAEQTLATAQFEANYENSPTYVASWTEVFGRGVVMLATAGLSELVIKSAVRDLKKRAKKEVAKERRRRQTFREREEKALKEKLRREEKREKEQNNK